LLDAAEHASELLAVSTGSDSEMLRDRWLLADVGMPGVPAAMADVVELQDPREMARHRAYLLWGLADELAWVHMKWGAIVAALAFGRDEQPCAVRERAEQVVGGVGRFEGQGNRNGVPRYTHTPSNGRRVTAVRG